MIRYVIAFLLFTTAALAQTAAPIGPSGGAGGGGSGTVTSIATNNGVTGGTITNTGTIGLAPISSGGFLCNNSGSSAPPTTGNCAPGTGVATAFGDAVNGAGGFLTYGIIGTSGATVPLLNGANAFSELDTFSAGITVSGGSLSTVGNRSAAAWTTSGLKYIGGGSTLTDTSSSGTVATVYNSVGGGDTNAASSATTYTNAYSWYFKAPVAGSNVTFTHGYALGADSINATTLYQGGTALASTFAPLTSPTFSGTVTGPDSGTWTSSGLKISTSGGSASAPLLTFGNSNQYETGWYVTGTNGWGFSSAGTQVLSLSAATLTMADETTIGSVGSGTSNNAAALNLTAGANTGTSSGNAGAVNITAGSATGVGSTGNGGSVVITAGTTVGGTAGTIALASPTSESCASGLQTNGSGVLSCIVSRKSVKIAHGEMTLAEAQHIVDGLLGQKFGYRDEAQYGGGERLGYYADDVCSVDERLCERRADGSVQSYDVRGVIAAQNMIMQEQQAEIEALKKELVK